MAEPTELAMQALKLLEKYIMGKPGLVWEFPWQDNISMDTYMDTDWAGCVKTMISTSGGCILLGKHVVKAWSSIQEILTLSPGEAEMAGVTELFELLQQL